MIQITRSQTQQLRAIFRKSVHVNSGRHVPASVAFRSDEQGLRVRSQGPEVAVEYHQRGSLAPETVCLPAEALADFAGTKDTVVALTNASASTVEARWDDGGVPQTKEYDVKQDDRFPEFPEATVWEAQEPRLLATLHAALQTTSKDAVRYALTRIQLRGGKAGQVVATDGRQLLVEGGFRFPWTEHLLIPAIPVFGCKTLPTDVEIAITRTPAHVGVRVGPWTFWLRIETEGRYPRVEEVIPPTASRLTTCRLAASEAGFLAQTLPRLPGEDDEDDPITLDLNGHVAVRSKGTGQVTEVDLPTSSVSGPPIRCRTNRRYLARALALGFTEFQFANADKPVACLDGPRTYVWMPLPKERALPPGDDVVRIVPSAQEECRSPKAKKRKPIPMPAPTTNGHANGHAAERPAKSSTETQPQAVSLGTLITEAQSLKDALRDAYLRSGRLLAGLKRHRRQSKLLASTVTALKQLQSIGG